MPLRTFSYCYDSRFIAFLALFVLMSSRKHAFDTAEYFHRYDGSYVMGGYSSSLQVSKWGKTGCFAIFEAISTWRGMALQEGSKYPPS